MHKICTIKGCGGKHHAKGFCKKHYLRSHLHGDPNTVLREVNRIGPGLCSVDGCSKSRISRGWCTLHYMRWKEHDDPLYEPEPHLCSVRDCKRLHSSRGFCSLHYNRWREHGDPLYERPKNSPYKRRTIEERFWANVDQEGPLFDGTHCWLWTGYTKDSYGLIKINKTKVRAHRLSWILLRGDIPDDHDIHHQCENTLCVNPDHLEPLTRSNHTRIHNQNVS